jgi:hypothetical protein
MWTHHSKWDRSVNATTSAVLPNTTHFNSDIGNVRFFAFTSCHLLTINIIFGPGKKMSHKPLRRCALQQLRIS